MTVFERVALLFEPAGSLRPAAVTRALLAFLLILSLLCLAEAATTRDPVWGLILLAGILPAAGAGVLQRRSQLQHRSRLRALPAHLLALTISSTAGLSLGQAGGTLWPVAFAPLLSWWVVARTHARGAALPYLLLLAPATAILRGSDGPWLLFVATAAGLLALLWPSAAPDSTATEAPIATIQLNTLKRFSQLLSQARTLREMFVDARQEILPLFNASGISIFLINESGDALRWAYGFEYGAEVDLSSIGPLPLEKGFAGHVARSGEPLLLNRDLPEQIARFQSFSVGAEPGAWLGAPLIVAGKTIGVVAVENGEEAAAFDEKDRELLTTIAGPLAIAMHNWLQLEQVEAALQTQSRQSLLLRTGAEVSAAVTTTLDADLLTQQVVDLVQQRFNYDYVGLFFLTPDGKYAVLQAGTGELGHQERAAGLRLAVGGPTLVGQATARGMVQLRQTAVPDGAPGQKRLTPEPTAELAIPLRSRGGLLGALNVHSNRPYAFDDQAVAALQTLSDQLAGASENARLFAQAQESLVRLNNLFLASRRIIQAQEADLIFATLTEHALASGQIDGAHLIVPNPRTPEQLMFPAFRARDGVTYRPDRHTIEETPFSSLMPQRELLRFGAADWDATLDPATREILGQGHMGSLVLVPVVREDHWFGSLALLRRGPEPLTLEEVRPYVTLCNQAAAALANRQLLRETNALYRASRNLSQVITRDDALTIALRELAEHVAADQCRVVLYDGRLGYGRLELAFHEVELSSSIHFPMAGDAVYEKLRATRQPLILRDDGADQRLVAIYLRPFEAQTSLLIPAYSQQDLLGFIAIDSRSPRREFTPAQINFARTLVDQLSVQIDNLVLFDEALNRAQDMITLTQIGNQISATLDLDALAGIIQEQVGRLMDNSIFLLAIYDPETRRYQPLLTSRYGERFHSSPRQLHEDEVLHQFLHQNVRVDDNNALELGEQAGLHELYVSGWKPESALWVPMRQEGEPMGMLSVQSYRPHAYDDNHLQLLRTIATQAGLALTNAQLFQQTEQTLAELRTIFEITQAAGASPNPSDRLQRLSETLQETFQDATVMILSVDRQARRLDILAQAGDLDEDGPPPSLYQGVIRDSIFNSQPLLVNDLRRVPGYDPLNHGLSQMVVPLTVGERTIGLINVESPTTEAFSEADLRLVQTLGVSVAASIESSRLFTEIQTANEQLRELDRLKMQFLANMSHELRTPLNSIIGFSRVILKGIDGPITEQQSEDLEAIYNSGQHLLSIINDILDVARIEAGKLALVFDTVNMVEMADRVIATVRGLMRDKSIAIHVNIEPDLPLIEADPVRLRQIMLNLLSNAAKFTERGEIRLAIGRYSPRNGTGRLVHLPAITIVVSDTGPGIAPEHFDKVFQAFEQIDASATRLHEGTGLGLPITKRLVDLHRGEITFRSEVGRGTTFTIVLPVRQPPEPDLIARQKEALSAALARYRQESQQGAPAGGDDA